MRSRFIYDEKNREMIYCGFFSRSKVFIKSELKVGIIYVKENQFTEEQILDNNDNSPLFDEFLQVLGDKVRLRGFDKYKGGLDTVHDLTGDFPNNQFIIGFVFIGFDLGECFLIRACWKTFIEIYLFSVLSVVYFDVSRLNFVRVPIVSVCGCYSFHLQDCIPCIRIGEVSK